MNISVNDGVETVPAAATSKPKSGRKVAAFVKQVVTRKSSKISDLVRKPAAGNADLKVSWGADPELMVYSLDEQRIVSSIPVLKRDKHNPLDLGNGVKLFADNVLAEFSMSPSDSKDEMIERMRDAFTRIQAHIGDKYRLLPQASHVYRDDEMAPSHAIDPTECGCNPSYDAFKVEINQPSPFTDNMRTGSFHIHIGNKDWNGKNDGRILSFNSRHDTIKLLNVYTVLASVIVSNDTTSKARRAIYGRSFEFRPTSYGCEMRSLDPFHLRSPALVSLILDLTNHALDHIKNCTEQDILGAVDLEAVGAAINNCDKGAALAILSKLDLSSKLMARVKKDWKMPDFTSSWGL